MTRWSLSAGMFYLNILRDRKHPPKRHLYRCYFQMESVSQKSADTFEEWVQAPALKTGISVISWSYFCQKRSE